MAQKIITIVLVLIVIGGLAWYVDKTYLQPSKSQSNLSKVPVFKSTGSTTSNIEEVQPQLIYLTAEDDKVIKSVGADGTSKDIFTDADETDKIIKASNYAPTSKEVLAITSEDIESKVGKLVVINLQDQKSKLLQSSFVVPDEWAASFDGKKIAYVRFSNIEDNYGYTLYSQERDGSSTRELVNNSKPIKNLAWNATGDKIAYTVTNENKIQLNIFDIENAKSDTIKEFDNTNIDWLSFSGEKIILCVRNIETTDAGIVEVINQDGGNLQKIVDYSGGIANFAYMYDSSFLSYVVAQYDEAPDEETTGQIYIYKVKNEEIKPVQKGVQVLGWDLES